MKAKQFGFFVFSVAMVVAIVLAGCRPSRPSPIPSEVPSPTALVPTATPPQMIPPTVTPSPTPAVAPGILHLDCSSVTPFAPGCLDQARPPELASMVTFLGIIPPPGPVTVAAWSPDGTRLAYTSVNPDGWSRVQVRQSPDFGLVSRWRAAFVSDLIWIPSGEALLFVFDRGDTTSIGLARLGEADWQDLLPGGKAVLAVSLAKNFVNWSDEDVLTFQVGCGTGCSTLYALEIATGDLRPLVNAWGEPDAPYANVFATVYLFSPNQRWLAATNWGTGLPKAMVLEWPGPAESLDLSARLDDRYTEAQSWMGGSLAFVAYPPGEPDDWPLPLQPALYIWDGDTEVMRRVASGALRALFSPNSDRLAVLFVGEPRTNEKGQIESDGSVPHLGLFNWPEGRLLATYPVSTKGISDLFDLWRLPTPIWARHGRALAFQPAEGGLALMGQDGDVWPILTGKVVNWVDWGDDNLALLLDEEIWLVRGSVQMPTSGTRTYTDAVLGIALDIPAKWEVYGFQGAEAHIVALDTIGTAQGVLTFSVIGPDTLDSTLEEVKRGAWGPHIRAVESVHLGEFEALRLELTPGEERPPVVWLLVTPSGLGMGFTPDNDLALAEPMLATLKAVPVLEPWEAITPTPSTGDDLKRAREDLIAFFSLLHAQRYGEATNYYGGTYDILRDWNPTVARDDRATLFKNGCTINRLMCLRIRTIVREEQVSPTELRFTVEFMNDDGTLFVLGPCCGATEEEIPPQTEFTFSVKKVDGRCLVQDLPVYVP